VENGTHLVQRPCQVLAALLMRDIPVGLVGSKEFLLLVQCRGHGLLRIDVLLTPIHDANETELEGVCPPGQDMVSVSPRIHEIELGKSDSATTLRVHRSGELWRFRVRKFDIRSGNRKD